MKKADIMYAKQISMIRCWQENIWLMTWQEKSNKNELEENS